MIDVRPAFPDERTALEELQRRSSLVWEEYRDALVAHPDAIDVPAEHIAAGAVRVATDDGAVVGFSTVLMDGSRGELDALFVEPERMRSGIGRVLIDDATAFVRRSGGSRLDVTANPRALGFYEKTGFVADGEVATRFGPGVRMHLELRPPVPT